jgi:hypothetical protein
LPQCREVKGSDGLFLFDSRLSVERSATAGGTLVVSLTIQPRLLAALGRGRGPLGI